MQRIPSLVGISGHFIGEVYPLEYGKPLTVGRSRTADFSLRRTLRYKSQEQSARDKDESAKTISAKHFQITMYNLRSIEVKNLSPNGTQLDGKTVEMAVINDIATHPHEIKIGTDDFFRLEMRDHEDQ